MQVTLGIRIVVLDRGWVMIGHVESHPDLAHHWIIRGAMVIRVWGTSQGLSELANGPLPGTVLDPPADADVPFRAVLFFLAVEDESWRSVLSSQPASQTRPRPASTPTG